MIESAAVIMAGLSVAAVLTLFVDGVASLIREFVKKATGDE